jgi:hypothetical protein
VSDPVEALREELMKLLNHRDWACSIDKARINTLTRQAAQCLIRLSDEEHQQRRKLKRLFQLAD